MATIQDIADRLGVSKGTVSKAINNAPDISETLRKTVLDTAVEMGYTRLRRQKNDAKRFCILIENMEYEEPHQFGYDFVIGFRQFFVFHNKFFRRKIMYREHTKVIKIGNKKIGGGNPVLIQSMTNTRTDDVEATVKQIHLPFSLPLLPHDQPEQML